MKRLEESQVPSVKAATRITEMPPLVHLVGPGTLACTGKVIRFLTDQNSAFEFDPSTVSMILLYGDVSIDAQSIKRLTNTGTHLAFLTAGGRRCYARLAGTEGALSQNRLRQLAVLSNKELALGIARETVVAKIEAMVDGHRRLQRSGQRALRGNLQKLRKAIARAHASTSIDQLRGIEGQLSKHWFSIIRRSLPSGWDFPSRSARPPIGPVNALLSFGYTLLHERMLARVHASGLEPELGSLHSHKPGRAALVCDLMEPLRLPLVDRWVLAICKQSIVSPKDFVDTETPGTKILRSSMSQVIASYERHWNQQKGEETAQMQVTRFVEMLKKVEINSMAIAH